jgi:ubiquinone/menaquinone biosynthesis C-methylase UbiE
LPQLSTRQVREASDVRRFFDALAEDYRESHGDADRLLCYRLRLIRQLLRDAGRGCLVEIGCGNGVHLFPLTRDFETVIGTDLSPRMIAAADAIRTAHPYGKRVRLAADPAERLVSVPDRVADAVLCVGAFEHMLDQRGALREVERVLKPGGAFVCLSANGGYLWHTRLAPWLGIQTRHLSTDRFLSGSEWPALLHEAGLDPVAVGSWRFVPAGDMPKWGGMLMRALDGLGAALRMPALRGGCYVKAFAPPPWVATTSS